MCSITDENDGIVFDEGVHPRCVLKRIAINIGKDFEYFNNNRIPVLKEFRRILKINVSGDKYRKYLLQPFHSGLAQSSCPL